MTKQPFLCQWLARINRTADKCSVSPKGEVVSIERPSPAELNRHELMLVTSLIHETQHIATYVFLDSDPDNTDSVPVKSIEPEASGASGIKSPAPNPAGPRKRTAPPHIGTCTFEGQDIGDSGFALQEIIFGGRLGHVEPGSTPFEVHALNSARSVSVCDINILLLLQMSGLTADVQVEDRPAKPRRVRLSDEYVSKLLDCLKHGRCTALLISHRAFRLIRFWSKGTGGICTWIMPRRVMLRFTKARRSTTPKSAATRFGADWSGAHIARITCPHGREAGRQSSGPDMEPGTLK